MHDCGFVARSTLELSDAGQVRLDKIYRLIAASKYGIHDLSRTEVDRSSKLPRFNMPLELGIFLGAKRFGGSAGRQKQVMVLIRRQHLHQRYCSDLAGQDVYAHGQKADLLIAAIRKWFRTQTKRTLPGERYIQKRYHRFRREMPAITADFRLLPEEVEFNDLTHFIAEWILLNR